MSASCGKKLLSVGEKLFSSWKIKLQPSEFKSDPRGHRNVGKIRRLLSTDGSVSKCRTSKNSNIETKIKFKSTEKLNKTIK